MATVGVKGLIRVIGGEATAVKFGRSVVELRPIRNSFVILSSPIGDNCLHPPIITASTRHWTCYKIVLSDADR